MKLILGVIIGFLAAVYNPELIDVYKDSTVAETLEGMIK